MISSWFAIVFCLYLVCQSQCSVFLPGSCPNDRPIVKDFQLNKYAGLWYEYIRKNDSYTFLGDCNTVTYIPHGNGTIGIKEFRVLSDPVREETDETFAVFSNPAETPLEARWNISYHWNDPYFENHRILDTDYESYSITYICLPAGPDYVIDEFLVYTRKPKISKELDNHLMSTVAKYYNTSLLLKPKHVHSICGSGSTTNNKIV